ncbi:MAG: NAD(P)-dependent alcohol dehydrogenase [Spirochaetales bacterium]|uniref:NAD(P)-dependent alcohol dehydrogenase n=1 Tax=Candidatus Thalassospirochaeta sargassi TaxID=3119039 RepID=A0AAJ1MJR5_9SPIO|nr:NAD(P)-dependent alcohol dehydrogenase [Spirochaetales bacterium]
MSTMKAAVMTGIRKIEIQDVPKPEIKPDEVLVKIKHVGICGSDIHYYEYGNIGDYVIKPPFILGHESGGEVVELGADVKNLKVGDQVALEPGIPCGECEVCKRGDYHLCNDVKFLATPPYDGVFAEYIAYPENMAFKLPEGCDTVEGAMIEPLDVALHALDLAGAKIGESALVFGCGCIGLLIIKTLQAAGVKEIYAVDVLEPRIKKAEELGVKAVWNGKTDDVIEQLMKATNGRGVDMAFEAAGTVKTTQQTIAAIAKGGRIVITGMAAEETIPVDIIGLVCKEGKIFSQFRYKNLYPKGIKLVADKSIDVKDVISDTCRLEDLPEMFEKCINEKDKVIKAVVEL